MQIATLYIFQLIGICLYCEQSVFHKGQLQCKLAFGNHTLVTVVSNHELILIMIAALSISSIEPDMFLL